MKIDLNHLVLAEKIRIKHVQQFKLTEIYIYRVIAKQLAAF